MPHGIDVESVDLRNIVCYCRCWYASEYWTVSYKYYTAGVTSCDSSDASTDTPCWRVTARRRSSRTAAPGMYHRAVGAAPGRSTCSSRDRYSTSDAIKPVTCNTNRSRPTYITTGPIHLNRIYTKSSLGFSDQFQHSMHIMRCPTKRFIIRYPFLRDKAEMNPKGTWICVRCLLT